MTNTLSFPGLGIGEFTINPIAFEFGFIKVAWYGIIITLGVILGVAYTLYRSEFEEIKSDDIYDLTLFVVIFAVIGARVYYVLTNLDSYKTFMSVISVWNGGIAIYGAIIAGGITTVIVAKIKKINPAKMLDLVAPAVMIGQIIGRWGNFTNAEAFGSETILPWRMGIQNALYYPETIYVHPTFLYESLWNLVGFIGIHFIYKHKKYNGQIFLLYMTWYGFGRMLIEALRTDSLYIGSFKISQLVGFTSFVVGVILLIFFGIKANKQIELEEIEENNENEEVKEENGSDN
ncbi:MAG: prolipoprotein diacylglyceryl transferase [Oscillospiraceae bacterium]|nr:prolipoprotein diacylglyceryl transferase [Oscillospiraceae bacterium]